VSSADRLGVSDLFGYRVGWVAALTTFSKDIIEIIFYSEGESLAKIFLHF
jgi:hypothetical protein